jgi:hypothetical protein
MKKMRLEPSNRKEVTVYQPVDLESAAFMNSVAVAKARWKAEIEKYFQKKGDYGTCVLGAGIKIYFMGKRKRTPEELCLINPHEISPCQGSATWEASVGKIVKQLNAEGIECWFDYGRMD